MQVTETKTEELLREYTIMVPASEIDAHVDERLKEVGQTVNLPGFRPGKAPMSLLKKKYGQNVMGEVLDKVISDNVRKTLTEKELKPAMQPKVEITKFEEGSDLEYTIAVELLPEIKLMDFSKLKLERLVAEAEDKDIDTALERLADVHKISETVESKRKLKNGDVAVIDFVGSVDGEEFPGGKGDDYPLELGSGSFIPGFEEQVVGAKVGDALDVKVSFPEEYGAAELAGKDAVFAVTVKELRESQPHPYDDELAKKVGMDTLDELKQKIRDDHGDEFNAMSRSRMKRELLDMLADGHDFTLPGGLVSQEADAIWGQLEEARKSGQNVLDDEDKDKSDEELRADFDDIAARRVRLGLVLSEVGHVNQLQVGQEDVNKAIMAECRKYPGQEKAVMDYYAQNAEAREQMSAPLYEDKVVDFIMELAKVTDKTVSAEELMQVPDEKPKKKAAAKKKAPAKKKAATKKADDDKPAEKKAAAKKPAAKKPAAKKAAAKKKD